MCTIHLKKIFTPSSLLFPNHKFTLTIPLSWQSLDDIAKFMTTCCPNEGLAMAVATRTTRLHRIIHHSLQKWFQN